VLLIILVVSITVQAKYSGGSGTADAPYQIANVDDLLTLAEDINDYNKCFILTDDIDLDPNLPGGQVFNNAVIARGTWDIFSSGFVGGKFSGVFDGTGHKISNLTIDSNGISHTEYLGLFGYVDGGKLKNLQLKNVNIICKSFAFNLGGLAGYCYHADINGCSSGGIIDAGIIEDGRDTDSLGGLIGYSSHSTISNSFSMVSVASGDSSNGIGGLVGTCNEGAISNSYSTGSIKNGSFSSAIGGLVGNSAGSINNCFSTVSVASGDSSNGIGGLAGICRDVSNSYSTGGITAGDESSNLGGLVGFCAGSTISDCYATGDIAAGDASSNLGGLVGRNDGTISDCYATCGITAGDESGNFGGLVGQNEYGYVGTSFSECNITGGDNSSNLGGLMGNNYKGTISNCFAAGKVAGAANSSNLGGLVGLNFYGNVINSLSTTVVGKGRYTGGLVGQNGYGNISSDNISSCYFLSGTGPNNKLGTPLSAQLMRQQDSFVGWDFTGETTNGTEDIWSICEGIDYPKLAWNFEGSCHLVITKCTVKDGDTGGSIYISGLMAATDEDFASTDALEVHFCGILSDYFLPNRVSYFPITLDTYRNNTFKLTTRDSKSHLMYNLKTHKFNFSSKDIDLSGLCSPIAMTIIIGTFASDAQVDEKIINGPKRPIPMSLMMGVANSLRVDKSKFTCDKKTGNIIRVAISGGFSVGRVDLADLVAYPLYATVGSQTFTMPAGVFKNSKSKFTCSKVLLPDGEIAAATFDFNKCVFKLTIKNTEITDSGDAKLNVAFKGFSENADVFLP